MVIAFLPMFIYYIYLRFFLLFWRGGGVKVKKFSVRTGGGGGVVQKRTRGNKVGRGGQKLANLSEHTF